MRALFNSVSTSGPIQSRIEADIVSQCGRSSAFDQGLALVNHVVLIPDFLIERMRGNQDVRVRISYEKET